MEQFPKVSHSSEDLWLGRVLSLRTWNAAVVVGLSLLAWCQERTVVPAPRLEKGFVEGKSYENPALGLEFTPDPSLKLGVPEQTGTPRAPLLYVSVLALGKVASYPGLLREAIAFSAVALAYYPTDQRSTEACMGRVIQANRNDGFTVVESQEEKLGGISFARTDFSRKGPAYEAVLVRACDRQALIFAFTGSSREAVEKLIAGTQLTIDLTRSGCGSGQGSM
jgi:hypothetical protein